MYNKCLLNGRATVTVLCACAHACVLTWRPEVDLVHLPTFLPYSFETSYETWDSLIWLDWLTVGPQRLFYLYLPSGGVTGEPPCLACWLLLGIELSICGKPFLPEPTLRICLTLTAETNLSSLYWPRRCSDPILQM